MVIKKILFLFLILKGVGEPIRTWGAEKTCSKVVYQNLESTDQHYKHNVLTYLTYIMPKEESKKRFEKTNE